MYLTTNFQFKPLNPQKLLKQYQRLNDKLPSANQMDRASILKYMTDQPLEVLSHEIHHKGITRRPITGLSVIKDTSTVGYPSKHISYIASVPVKSPLAKSGAVDDLGNSLMESLGPDGIFDMTPNNGTTRAIYESKLGITPQGKGTTRGIKLAKRTGKRD